jgi:hypothetical protein
MIILFVGISIAVGGILVYSLWMGGYFDEDEHTGVMDSNLKWKMLIDLRDRIYNYKKLDGHLQILGHDLDILEWAIDHLEGIEETDADKK